MAIARKCDRCSKYYDENKYLLKNGRDGARPNAITYMNYRSGSVSNNIDLCDECFNKLEFWLKNEE